MFLVFCLLQKLSSTHLTLHPLDLKTTPPHPSLILQLNKYLTQANVSSPGISFDTIKHSNHIDDNVFVIQFLIWGQRKTEFPHPFMHAWRVTHHGLYTDKYIWLCPVHVHIHLTVCWLTSWLVLRPGDYQAKLTAPFSLNEERLMYATLLFENHQHR